MWSRDHGPITIWQGDHLEALDFRFTGWGGKFSAERDDVIPTALAPEFQAGVRPIDFVLEGGAIESDGLGSILTTSSVLLNPNRNPGLDRAGAEAALRGYLGATRVLWLEHGHLEGDDTDGHVDTVARFCDPETIAYVRCDDPSDSHVASFAAMERELQALRTPSGAPYRLVPLPWPRAVVHDGARIPLTYANFLITDTQVLVPTYRDPADGLALARVAECFPGRTIVAIDALPLVYQYGSIHCATMQLPRGLLRGALA